MINRRDDDRGDAAVDDSPAAPVEGARRMAEARAGYSLGTQRKSAARYLQGPADDAGDGGHPGAVIGARTAHRHGACIHPPVVVVQSADAQRQRVGHIQVGSGSTQVDLRVGRGKGHTTGPGHVQGESSQHQGAGIHIKGAGYRNCRVEGKGIGAQSLVQGKVVERRAA